MIIADKFEPIDEDGNLSGEDIVYVRTKNNCHYGNLVLKGFTSMNDNVTMQLAENEIVICPETDENAPVQVAWVGKRFGVAMGSKVRMQLIFVDGKMLTVIVNGFINIGSEGADFFYESYLTPNDEMMLNSDKDLHTQWISFETLFSAMNAVNKNAYKTIETMYELEISCDKTGTISYKTIDKYDLSNGKVEEMERLEKEEKERVERERKEQEKLRREQAKKKQDRAELVQNTKTGIEVQAMFDKLLHRRIER